MPTIKRQLEKELLGNASFFPVVTILGPSQSGKTTLAGMTFPSYSYTNLEDPKIFEICT